MPTAPPTHRCPGWAPRQAWAKGPKGEARTLVGRPWRRLRDRILKRDCYVCIPCRRQGRATLATQCDHILPLAQGGTDEEANLQAICDDCHTAKTQAESQGKSNPACTPKPKGCDVHGRPYGRVDW